MTSIWPHIVAPSDIIAAERDAEYTAYNVGRYRHAFAACMMVRPERDIDVLDIGNSDFTRQLRDYYREVWTLGFPGPNERHIVYNLNDSPVTPPPTDRQFDLITFNEVIEHLHTAPETILSAVSMLLKQGGHLVVQTPNAAALNKRLKLLFGMNPYERLRVDHTNPGHLRECTKDELAEISRHVGFKIVDHRCIEYCGVYGRGWKNYALYALRAAAWLWPTFARSQQIVLRKPSDCRDWPQP